LRLYLAILDPPFLLARLTRDPSQHAQNALSVYLTHDTRVSLRAWYTELLLIFSASRLVASGPARPPAAQFFLYLHKE
jgi:hypothetical protein